MKSPKPYITGLCEGNPPVTGRFPSSEQERGIGYHKNTKLYVFRV